MNVILLTDCRINIENIIKILLDNNFEIFGICFGQCVIAEDKQALCREYQLQILSKQELIKCSGIDVILSYGYTHYIPKKVFSSVKYCINFHPGLLPEYKGCYTLYYGMINGEKEWGMTAHFVNEKFDEGEIILIEKFTLDYEKTGKEIVEYIWDEVGINAVKNIVSMIKENKIPSFSQKNSKMTCGGGGYYSRERLNREKSISIGSFKTLDSKEIIKKIRAMWYPPYDGLRIKLEDEEELFLLDRKIWDTIKGKI